MSGWRVLSQRPDRDFLEVADESGLRQIAEVAGPERLVRVHLIAAAPELNDALQAAQPDLERLYAMTPAGKAREALADRIRVGRAALAKARGE